MSENGHTTGAADGSGRDVAEDRVQMERFRPGDSQGFWLQDRGFILEKLGLTRPRTLPVETSWGHVCVRSSGDTAQPKQKR